MNIKRTVSTFGCTFFVSKSTRLPTPNLYLRMSLLFQLFDIFGRRTVELQGEGIRFVCVNKYKPITNFVGSATKAWRGISWKFAFTVPAELGAEGGQSNPQDLTDVNVNISPKLYTFHYLFITKSEFSAGCKRLNRCIPKLLHL